MRLFETLLIVANFFSLFVTLKKQSKAAWLWIAGINISLFYIHFIVEGFRYQMFFSYLFVILLTIFTLLKINQIFEFKVHKALTILAVSVSFVFLLLTTLLAYALPVFTLPQPTGPYAVGIQYIHLIDRDRADPFLAQTTKRRELMVKVYYPAKEDDTKPFSSYFRNSHELLRLLASGYNMPVFLFDHLTLVKTHSKENLQISDLQPKYPVILFSHGAGTSMETQTSQSEDLASHGYVVVCIDHTYASAGTIFPDHIVSAKEATTNFDVPEPAEIITQIMADDSSFVIDQLTGMNEGTIKSAFKNKLDLENIGAMGHSVGGAVAYNLAINEDRIRAAVDLDGVVFITPKGDPKDVIPFLLLANDRYHIQAIESGEPLMKRFEEMDDVEKKITVEIYGSEQNYNKAYHKAQRNITGLIEVLRSSGNLFTITGSDHMKFTDIGLFIGSPQLREMIGISGNIDPTRCLEMTEALTLAFFDQHLKGNNQVSLESLIQKYPELERVNLK